MTCDVMLFVNVFSFYYTCISISVTQSNHSSHYSIRKCYDFFSIFLYFKVFAMLYPYLPEVVSDWFICRVTGHLTEDILRGNEPNASDQNGLKSE